MRYIYPILAALVIVSCKNNGDKSGKEKADLMVYNAIIYTVDSSFSTVEAMLIKDGKILATGDTASS